jgi:GTP diphosphokinase / guanosine-3',5'-bis(diphosphate) 3'-diphosphatase
MVVLCGSLLAMQTIYDAALRERATNLLRSWNVSADYVTSLYPGTGQDSLVSSVYIPPEVNLLLDYYQGKGSITLPSLARIGINTLLGSLAIYFSLLEGSSHGPHWDPIILEMASKRVLPLLKRLGMWEFKRNMEDTLFRQTNPNQYNQTNLWLMNLKANSAKFWASLAESTRQRCLQVVKECTIDIEYCHIEGANRRFLALGGDLRYLRPEAFIRFNAVVHDVSDCYTVLGAINQIGVPEPNSFKDLIVVPRSNGYSGILSNICVFPFENKRKSEFQVIEFAIQTKFMQQVARLGITQKDCYSAIQTGLLPTVAKEELACLKRLLDVFSNSSAEKPSKIMVFTAKNDLKKMRTGATALDLAYKIHSDIGNQAISAEVNGQTVPLSYELKQYDSVRITTDLEKNVVRGEEDLDYVVEPNSKKRIKQIIYRTPVNKGRLMLSEYLRKRGASIENDEIDQYATIVAPVFDLNSASELYMAIARSTIDSEDKSIKPSKVGGEIVRRRRLKSPELRTVIYTDPSTDWVPEITDSLDGLNSGIFRLCSLCRPSPSSEIVGVKTKKYIAVHTIDCYKSQVQHQIKLRWSRVARMVKAVISLHAMDRPLLVNNVSEVLFRSGCGLGEVHGKALDFGQAVITLHIYTRDAVELVQTMLNLRNIRSVQQVRLESTSLPHEIKSRIQQGNINKSLIYELEGKGYGKPGAKVLLNASHAAQRMGRIFIKYAEQKPTFTSDVFFGRQDDIRWLQDHTVNAGSGLVLISGMKRIGKTSLCFRFLDNTQQNHPDETSLVRIDLRGFRHSPSPIILREIYNSLGIKFGLTYTDYCNSEDLTLRVEAILSGKGVNSKPQHLVIVLDEFGGPVESFANNILGNELFDFINKITDLQLPLSMILVTPVSARILMDESNVWDALRGMPERNLKPLSLDEAKEMVLEPVRQNGVFFAKGALNKFLSLCQGYPYYIILLLKEVAQNFDAHSHKLYITEDDISSATERLLKSDASFRYLWNDVKKIPFGEALVRALADLKIGSHQFITEAQLIDKLDANNQKELVNVSLQRLVTSQILQRSDFIENKNNGYKFSIPLFDHWVQRISKSQN